MAESASGEGRSRHGESGALAGRVAVVTGSSGGIGRATAQAISAVGARAIVLADLAPEPRDDGPATAELLDCEHAFVATDVSVPEQIEAAVAAAERFGGLDAMVNVAGIIRTGSFLKITEADYDAQMAVNAKGAFFGTQAAGRRMAASGGGAIVNVSSVAGLAGSAIAVAYSASKGAVTLLTYAAAQALGPRGVRVNAVHPGMVATEMARVDIGLVGDEQLAPNVPLGRAAQPEDVADAIVYLLSDAARYVSGTSLLVDGGYRNSLS